MKREILCLDCGILTPSNLADMEAGIETRRTPIASLSQTCACDRCAKPLPKAERAIAMTFWNNNREAEPRDWEHEYDQRAG